MPQIAGPITTGGTGYAGMDDSLVAGGLHVVSNTLARDSIPESRRKSGMKVVTAVDGKTYALSGTTGQWVWTEEISGGAEVFEMNHYTLLLNQALVVDGAPASVQDKRRFIAYLLATNVTIGATVGLEAQMPNGAWAPIHAEVFTTTGVKVLYWEGVFPAIRARIAAYTDGSYTIYLVA